MYLHLLTIVLVILKAMGYLSISWWLVFLPSIISIVVVLAFLALYVWSHT